MQRVRLLRRLASSIPNAASSNSTAATTTAATAAATDNAPMSLTTKGLIFTGFVGVVGSSSFAYMLATNEEFLISARDKVPGVVNMFAPLIGLPVEEDTGVLNLDAALEQMKEIDIAEVVGDEVKVVVKLRSGKVLLASAKAKDSEQAILTNVAKELGVTADFIEKVDPIIDMHFIDQSEAGKYSGSNDKKLQEEFGIRIPKMPVIKTKESLELALALCRLQERDLDVQMKLSEKYANDATEINKARADIEKRKQEIKDEMKKLPSQGLRGLLRR